MATTRRKKREPYARREGARLKPEVLEALMAARGVGSHQLARLTGLHIDTITQAKKGLRVRLTSIHKIADILDKLPVNTTAAALVGAPAPVALNGANGAKKKSGPRTTQGRKGEATLHGHSQKTE